MNFQRLSAILGLIFIGMASRLLPHPPNFTAINAIALFSAFYFGNRGLSYAIVFSTVFFSDVILGLHSTMPFVYLSFCLMILLGEKIKKERSVLTAPFACLAASSLFFLISNFGHWLVDPFYSKTISGLGFCYLAALPFFANQILGDLIYGILFFSCAHLTTKIEFDRFNFVD
jgi:hypothetical protein